MFESRRLRAAAASHRMDAVNAREWASLWLDVLQQQVGVGGCSRQSKVLTVR